ncbi:MAG TPA: hypothetical protein VGG27_13435 [Magnetospirillaceae bacterium]|jgi:hypothetical protein
MRRDMPRVIVTRPRKLGSLPRKGRTVPDEHLPEAIGMRRSVREKGGHKQLNEHLSPLRRYLEKQVGRPWDKVFSEISAVLGVDSTVQKHVRDHVWDYVTLNPRRTWTTFYMPDGSKLRVEEYWLQILYVDAKDGILKRSKDHPDMRRRRREAGKPPRVS